ncbi:protein OPAQUE10 isoform X2 [Zea mays]|uniref:protein OPAQUE10 isoform X2 n=2 Tax=Zea mays TaxID=4577 RepID=UPI0004DEA19A|nr:protein OPAQUE10 isoform X2 [Zea mays]|eukprot:XP_008665266.1 protein OPAQUE10 isoform X2 [Zea mays]
MSLHAARGGPHEDLSWSAIGRRAPRDVVTFGDREGGGGMRSAQQGPGAVRVDEASSASTFRELDEAFLQTQTKIWLGEVLHLRFGEDALVADLLADGELLFQVSKVLWKMLLKNNREQLKQSKVYIYERLSFGRSSGKYMPYSKVDSFLKICQILGLAGIDLFTPSDVVEKRNVRKVCICIRSVSKKSLILHLNVPDFDVVTYTISMPNYVVGGIRRNLEQTQYSSSSSSGYSPCARSKVLQQQNDQHEDTHYDSDEAESKLSLLEPEDSVNEDNFAAVLSQFNDAHNKGSEGYGESGCGKHGEKSLAESVGSLNIGIIDFEFMDSTPLIHDKESCSLLEPEDSVNEDNFAAVLSKFNDAPNKESKGYGESGRGKHGEKSLAESVGSLNIGIVDSEFMDSSPLIHDKESCSPLEPEGSVNEDNFTAVLSQFNDAPNKESEGYGESGCGKHGEKSLVESVGSLNIGIVDSEFMDSSPLIHDKESCSPLEPEDSVNEDNFAAVLSQFNDAPNKESEGYGESGRGKHGEKSLAESVGSLNIGIIDSEFMDSSPLIHDKESCFPLEPEGSVNEDNFTAVLSQFNDAPNKESEGYGESGCGKHGEKSLVESVGSLNIGIVDSEFMDSSPLIHDKESCSPLEPEDSVNEDNFTAVLSQFNDAPNKESEAYGESGCGKHGENSLDESVGSLNIGVIDSEFMDSSPLIHDKESCSPLEPEDSVNEDNFAAVLSQYSDGPNEGNEGYGESGHYKHEEKSLDESVGSLTIGIIDSEFMDSSRPIHDKESCSTGSAADQCSRTIPAKYELSSEESDSTGSHLVFDSGKNYLELNNHSVTDLERIYNGHATSVDQYVRGNGETLADHPKKEEAGLQKDTGTIAQHRDTLACDGESVCSSCEEPRRGLNGEPSDFSSESHSRLTPTHNTGGKLSMVSEHPVHNMESDMTGMASDSTNPELNPEASTRNEMDGSRSTDNPVEPENVAQDSATRGRPEGDAPRSGKGVLRSVAGGITLVGAVFFMFHLRRSKGGSFATVIPSLSGKSARSNARARNMGRENVPDAYPGGRLKA